MHICGMIKNNPSIQTVIKLGFKRWSAVPRFTSSNFTSLYAGKKNWSEISQTVHIGLAAVLPIYLLNFRAIGKFWIRPHALRLCEIWRLYLLGNTEMTLNTRLKTNAEICTELNIPVCAAETFVFQFLMSAQSLVAPGYHEIDVTSCTKCTGCLCIDIYCWP